MLPPPFARYTDQYSRMRRPWPAENDARQSSAVYVIQLWIGSRPWLISPGHVLRAASHVKPEGSSPGMYSEGVSDTKSLGPRQPPMKV